MTWFKYGKACAVRSAVGSPKKSIPMLGREVEQGEQRSKSLNTGLRTAVGGPTQPVTTHRTWSGCAQPHAGVKTAGRYKVKELEGALNAGGPLDIDGEAPSTVAWWRWTVRPASYRWRRTSTPGHGIGAADGQCKFATPAGSRIARHVIGLGPHCELVELGAEQGERRQRQDGRRQRPGEEHGPIAGGDRHGLAEVLLRERAQDHSDDDWSGGEVVPAHEVADSADEIEQDQVDRRRVMP
jgi:hypothetical protein